MCAKVLLLLAFASILPACGESDPVIVTVPGADIVQDLGPPRIAGTATDVVDSGEDAAIEADATDASEPIPPEDVWSAPVDTAAPADPGNAPEPDTAAPVPDEGPAPVPDDGPVPVPDEGPAPEPDEGPAPECPCGPDQVCVNGTCVPACQGGCECAPAPDACPDPPGGGVVPGATTPNEYETLQALAGTSANWAGCAAGDEVACHLFVREAARHLYEKDPSWGLLTKVPGQNQCSTTACGNDVVCGYAIDAIIHRASNQVVDMITSVGAPGSSVAWQLVGKLDYNHWAPPPCPVSKPAPEKDKLLPDESLTAGQKRVSADGRFQLEYQADGDLVLTHLGVGVLWSSGTQSAPGSAVMQLDGNFVVYDAEGAPQWASGTAGNDGAWLLIQSDGNAIVAAKDGTALWATDTCCY